MDNKLLNTKELAALLQIKPNSVIQWIKRNPDVPYLRQSDRSKYLFNESDVFAYMARKPIDLETMYAYDEGAGAIEPHANIIGLHNGDQANDDSRGRRHQAPAHGGDSSKSQLQRPIDGQKIRKKRNSSENNNGNGTSSKKEGTSNRTKRKIKPDAERGDICGILAELLEIERRHRKRNNNQK